jgi:hypothetical protein
LWVLLLVIFSRFVVEFSFVQVMSPTTRDKAAQQEQGLLSPVVSQAFTLDEQRRILCSLLVQCFTENQGIDEMMKEIQEVVKSFVPKILLGVVDNPSRWTLPKHHRCKVKAFIERMALSYNILDENLEEIPIVSQDESILDSSARTMQSSLTLANYNPLAVDSRKVRTIKSSG